MTEQTEQIVIKQQEINTTNGTTKNYESVVEPNAKAKSVIDNILLSIFSFVGKPWHKALPTLAVCNKLSVFILLLFFVSGFLPAIEMFSESQSLYELIEASTFQVIILVVTVLYALGVKRIISKVASIVLVGIVFYNLYEVYDMISGFTGGRGSLFSKNTVEMASEVTQFGLVIWVLSFIGLIIISLIPSYKANTELWLALVKVYKEESTTTVNVVKFTDSVNASIQSVTKAKKITIDGMNTVSDSEQVNKLRALSTKNKLLVLGCVGLLVIAIPMLFSGNSAPSNSDVERIIAQAIQEESGFIKSSVSDIKVTDCEEISDRELPTFTCAVDGVATFGLGALGELVAGKSEQSQSFSNSFTFVKGESGWYSND